MFANLKNKLIEEVKSSPSKIQQLASAAQAAVSSSSLSGSESAASSNTKNENFFSISEEDTPHNSPGKALKPHQTSHGSSTPHTLINNGIGTIPRTRKLSNSSMASDISFRLLSYDAPPSDLDETASEFDDSTSVSKLDVVSKEQLYDAYKNSLDRYHKYRCRYTDLAKKYKDLERDSSKARSVLIETQEKALRRIGELREQCTLEQQAKAHLEEALRMEMDDMNCKMQAYETKLKLLGENPAKITVASNSQANNTLIDLDQISEDSRRDNAILEMEQNDFEDKVLQLEQKLRDRDQQLLALNEKILKANETIVILRKQEEENSLLLAQTKQAIHSELENKEKEVKQLNNKVKEMEIDLQGMSKREQQLNSLQKEVKELKEKAKHTQMAKQEVDAKLIATEHLLNALREQYSNQEKTIENYNERTKGSDKKLLDMELKNAELEKMAQQTKEIVKDFNNISNENDKLKNIIAESENNLQMFTFELEEQKSKIEKLEQELIAEKAARATDHPLEENKTTKESDDQINAINQELESLKELFVAKEQELMAANGQVANKDKELKAISNKLVKLKKQHDVQELKIATQNEEMDKLQIALQEHENHLQALQRHEEQAEGEKNELKAQVANILLEIAETNKQMNVVQQSHFELQAEKLSLEARIEQMQKQAQQHANLNMQQLTVEEEKMRATETKLLLVESENAQLAEKNCLLEESSQRLEKLLTDHDRHKIEEAVYVTELELKLKTAEHELQILNEKMSQVLDENSRMQNAQELMEHDQRTSQDKYDALEKEMQKTQDANASLQMERDQQEEQINIIKVQLEELSRLHEEKDDHLKTSGREMESVLLQLEKAQNERQKVENELLQLNQQISKYEYTKTENKTLTEKLREIKEKFDLKVKAHLELEANLNDINSLRKANEEAKELENTLRDTLEEHKRVNETQTEEIKLLQSKLALNAKNSAEELQSVMEKSATLTAKEAETAEKCMKYENKLKNMADEISTLETKLSTAEGDIASLHESNDAFQVEIDQINEKHALQMADLKENLEQRQQELNKMKAELVMQEINLEKLQSFDQVQLENEYLNKHVNQLEVDLAAQKEHLNERQQESAELGEKFKSLQCEFYVLKEGSKEHDEQQENKIKELNIAKTEIDALKNSLAEERIEVTRQTKHADYIKEQNDIIQRDLLHTQQQLADAKQKLQVISQEVMQLNETNAQERAAQLQKEASLCAEIERNLQTIRTLQEQAKGISVEFEKKEQLWQETQTIRPQSGNKLENDNISVNQQEDQQSSRLQYELDTLKSSSEQKISSLEQEIENLQINNKNMMGRMMELESIRAGIQAQKLLSPTATTKQASVGGNNEKAEEDSEREELEAKLKAIMAEVQDVSNRNIFLEQKCENYLILEQSNERMKLQNAKLSRQLDETLVSIQHNESISPNTEFEYLKNIMFQYLTGSANGNNETLVKVISAVLKFTPQQTQVALEKEHQRRSLINKIL